MTQKIYQKEKLITFKSWSRLIWIENDNSDYDSIEVYNDDAISYVSPFRSVETNTHDEFMDKWKHYDITRVTVINFFSQIKKQNPNFMISLLSSPISIEKNWLWFLKNKSRLFDTELAYKSFFWACKWLRKEIDKLKDHWNQNKEVGKLYTHYISMLMGLKSIVLWKLECFPLKKDSEDYNLLFQAKYNYNDDFSNILDEHIAKIERFITVSIQDWNYKKYSIDKSFIEHYIRSVTFYN